MGISHGAVGQILLHLALGFLPSDSMYYSIGKIHSLAGVTLVHVDHNIQAPNVSFTFLMATKMQAQCNVLLPLLPLLLPTGADQGQCPDACCCPWKIVCVMSVNADSAFRLNTCSR